MRTKNIPILNVKNLAESVMYYVGKLGFSVERRTWDGTNRSVQVTRDGVSILLCQGVRGLLATSVLVNVADIHARHVEFLANGARVLSSPARGASEMSVEDLDGHILRIRSAAATQPGAIPRQAS